MHQAEEKDERKLTSCWIFMWKKVRMEHSLYNARTEVATKMKGRDHLTLVESITWSYLTNALLLRDWLEIELTRGRHVYACVQRRLVSAKRWWRVQNTYMAMTCTKPKLQKKKNNKVKFLGHSKIYMIQLNTSPDDVVIPHVVVMLSASSSVYKIAYPKGTYMLVIH
jgi:hypothetical protein